MVVFAQNMNLGRRCRCWSMRAGMYVPAGHVMARRSIAAPRGTTCFFSKALGATERRKRPACPSRWCSSS